MDGRTMAFLFGMFGFAWGLIAMVMSRSRADSLRQRRLSVLEKALEHPSLDEATRGEILRVLADEQRRCAAGPAGRVARLAPAGRVLWHGAAWILFVVGGCMLVVNALELALVNVRTFLPMTVTGLAMLSLPMALRELQARRQSASAVGR